jgi:hypothetical protein
MIPVAGKANLFRDPSTGAIINKDRSNAKIAREASAKRKADEDRLITLENDMTEIKGMLKTLLTKQKKK